MSNYFELKEFNKLKEFRDFTEENFIYNKNYIFRGQDDEKWPLETTLDRLINNLPLGLKKEKVIDHHLQRFRMAIRGRRGQNQFSFNSNGNDLDLWSIGQHYGLATPLLDWSFSPYIATFFAFNSSETPKSGKRCIWALNTSIIKEVNEKIIDRCLENDSDFKDKYFEKSRIPIIELVEPLLDDNQRIINQAGLFTRGPVLFPLNEWVKEFCNHINKVVLYKITLPDIERESILCMLEQMNINSSSLFPDISGACLYCNETLSLRAQMFNTKKNLFAKK